MGYFTARIHTISGTGLIGASKSSGRNEIGIVIDKSADGIQLASFHIEHLRLLVPNGIETIVGGRTIMNATKQAIEKKDLDTAPVEAQNAEIRPEKNLPIFVEAEKLFERMAEVTRETAHKAYEYFRLRGGEWGRELDDWFLAESELLRPVPLEIREMDDRILVMAAVPGFKPNEIEVSVKDDQLFLSGETKTMEENDGSNVIVQEWRSNRFLRQVKLPAEVDPGKVEAHLRDGMLEITMPKVVEREPAKIAVSPG